MTVGRDKQCGLGVTHQGAYSTVSALMDFGSGTGA
jgi:hypothetical protein